jgi:hypothetical protein
MAIRIFVTRGTFDKEYNEITGQLFLKEKEYRIKMLSKIPSAVGVKILL